MKASLIARGLSAACAVVLVACGGHAKGASSSRATSSDPTTTGPAAAQPAASR